MAASPQITIIV